MKIEQALITQLMVLLDIKNGKNRPSEISKELNITLQGVIYHIKILKEKKLIDDNNKITKEGFDFLYNGLSYIENFVHASLINIDYSLVWEVISDDNIKVNDRVYLYMKNGYLHATLKEKGDAYGISVKNTGKNECTGVTSVKGIINIKPSKIILLTIDNVEKIDNLNKFKIKLDEKIKSINYNFVGISGELSKNILDNLNIKIDFEYSAISCAFEASKRGFITLIVMSDRLFHFSLNEIKEMQTKNPEIEIDFLHA